MTALENTSLTILHEVMVIAALALMRTYLINWALWDRRIRRLTWLVCAAILLLAESIDAKDAPVPLEQVVSKARAIFVGRVLDVSPVTFEFDGEAHICGFRYRTQIERSFKGSSHVVEFFDPSSKNPLAPGNQVFAFLFSYDVPRLLKEDAATRIDSLLSARYRCQVERSSVTVKEAPRTLMRFAERFDSADWLVPPEFAPSLSLEVRMRPNSEGWYLGFARWDDVAQEIERILGEQEKTAK